MHSVLFLIGIACLLTLRVRSAIYLEDKCIDGEPTSFSILIREPFPAEISHTEYLEVSRNGSYTLGRNCSVTLIAGDDVIMSFQKIQFRPGCQDYIKVSSEEKIIGLCGSKNEKDSNMQFYGKNLHLNYFTEAEGPSSAGLIGFSLSFTAIKTNADCDTRYGFLCQNSYCIHKRFQCDGVNNCGDFSDEQKCGTGNAVIAIAMFLVTVMGVVGGFCMAVCLTAICTDFYKMVHSGSGDSGFSHRCCSGDSATAEICIFCF
ncbi:hypothetical protein JTE90_023250 [Oedothorax gibbosus]|uniref:CUB domain-containing protein n=1 Tax=Oedothorax gibbosus TaxID=931172 RepID=A0AAV6U3P4_9ARAC|nr:hypothetical protein JTE90_023250 [Oedothorax gibbosus]